MQWDGSSESGGGGNGCSGNRSRSGKRSNGNGCRENVSSGKGCSGKRGLG